MGKYKKTKYKNLFRLCKKATEQHPFQYWHTISAITHEINFCLKPKRGPVSIGMVSDAVLANNVKQTKPSRLLKDLVNRFVLSYRPY